MLEAGNFAVNPRVPQGWQGGTRAHRHPACIPVWALSLACAPWLCGPCGRPSPGSVSGEEQPSSPSYFCSLLPCPGPGTFAEHGLPRLFEGPEKSLKGHGCCAVTAPPHPCPHRLGCSSRCLCKS